MQTNFKPLGFNFEWLDVYDPTEAELRQLADQYKLPEAAVIDCLQPEHLPKYELFDNYSFIIVRFYDTESKPDSNDIRQLTRKIALFYNAEIIITIHRTKVELIENLAKRYCTDTNMQRPFNLACKIVKKTFETFEEPVKQLNLKIDAYEERIFLKKRIPDLLRAMYDLKRRNQVFRRVTFVSKLVVDNMHVSHRKNSYYEDMRDYHLKLEIAIDQIHEDLISLVNLYLSISSQRTNEVMRILTVFSAFFLPLTFIVGVYGMNFQYMPELAMPNGYPGVMLFMALVIVFIWQWFKRKNWL